VLDDPPASPAAGAGAAAAASTNPKVKHAWSTALRIIVVRGEQETTALI
jgi:hypothetical protein